VRWPAKTVLLARSAAAAIRVKARVGRLRGPDCAMAKILILDDEPLIAMMLADWVAEQGEEAIGPAFSADQALALIADTRLDAAILDVSLGNGNCYGVAQELRRSGVPFAFATGHGADVVREDFKNIRTLSKPFNFDMVGRVLHELLGSKAAL